MSRGREAVRAAVKGADRAFRVVDGGKGTKPPPPSATDDDPCPVTPLGDADGKYYFLDARGQARELTARQLGSRTDLLSLFRGDDTWLRRHFKVEKEFDDGEGGKVRRVVDFRVNDAMRHLMAGASARGLFGNNVHLRRPGVWRGAGGMPVVHCGDEVLIASEWVPSGTRTGDQIWVAGVPTPRPAVPCDFRVAQRIQEDLQNLWCFENPASAIAIIGLIFSGYLCGALSWRCNGFITGGTGVGKSSLRRVIQAAWPVHDYSNDTSKAGMEQTIAGRAIPAIIDESNDRNRSSGRDLIDIVLSASGDEGTKLARGTADGRGRSSEVISCVVMFSINPPELEPQHMNRFLMIELRRPDAGADHSHEHRSLAEYVKANAPALWGRAISSWDRYNESLMLFRDALRNRGCDPREMDGKGALLAGWWVLTHEGLPAPPDLREGVAALGDFIVTAKAAERDDGPRAMISHLMASMVQLHRSTDREPIGMLLDQFYKPPEDMLPQTAFRILGNYGIRPVNRCLAPPERRGAFECRCSGCFDMRAGKPVPRMSLGEGVWLSLKNPELSKVFHNTPFDAGRWRHELVRLQTAQRSPGGVRIGGNSGRAVWLDRADLQEPDDPP